MQLSVLAEGFEVTGGDRDIAAVTEDSRRAGPNTLFVAISGHAQDGHAYIADAIARGAVAVAGTRLDTVPAGIARVRTADPREALSILAARLHGHPARDLRLIGFTGTFGKTSTSEVLRALLEACGQRPGVLGSLGAKYGGFHQPGRGLTTPAPVELQSALRGLRDAGADRVIVEVTSHALRMRRAHGLQFSGGLLAAIQPGEHTDFHCTYEEYVEAKRLFLDYLAPDAVLAYDADNDAARTLASSRAPERRIGFSLARADADVRFSDVRLDANGALFRVERRSTPGAALEMRSALLGRGHFRNVALALTYAFAEGMDPAVAAGVLRSLRALPRRMERYTAAGRVVLDDTAAHPDSLTATFDVAALLPHRRAVAVYAVRGSRGVDINAHNAAALAGLASRHRIETLIVTASEEATAAEDAVTGAELDATRRELEKGSRPFVVHATLRDAIEESLRRTGAGDLIVLIGAQGMNQGRSLLEGAAG